MFGPAVVTFGLGQELVSLLFGESDLFEDAHEEVIYPMVDGGRHLNVLAVIVFGC